jgi:hypothetical protein
MTETTDEAVDKLLRAAFAGSSEDVVVAVLESLTSTEVKDVQSHSSGEFEFWLDSPPAITGDELDDVQSLFEVHEIGVYGDPLLAGTDEGGPNEGLFHMVLSIDV